MNLLGLTYAAPVNGGPTFERVAALVVLSASLISTSLAGCSHYGWASSAGHDNAPTAVAVSTVAVAADEGVDAARLTRALVGALDRRGLNARWTSDTRVDDANAGPTRVALRCSVTRSDVDGFGAGLHARARVVCNYVGADRPPRRFDATGRYSASTQVDAPAKLLAGHAAVQEAAALNAVESVARRVASAAGGNRR